MVRSFAANMGEMLEHAGTSWVHSADAIRVQYGNPREIPEYGWRDVVGVRLIRLGSSLIHFANPDPK